MTSQNDFARRPDHNGAYPPTAGGLSHHRSRSIHARCTRSNHVITPAALIVLLLDRHPAAESGNALSGDRELSLMADSSRGKPEALRLLLGGPPRRRSARG